MCDAVCELCELFSEKVFPNKKGSPSNTCHGDVFFEAQLYDIIYQLLVFLYYHN